MTPDPCRPLLDLYRPVEALRAAGSVLSWDRQLWMPPAGDVARTRHETEIAALQKALLTSDDFERALKTARADHSPRALAIVRSIERLRKPYVRLPLDLLRRKSEISGQAYGVWCRARAENDFVALAPYLEQLFAIARESAEHLGYEENPYDALLDLFEPGTTDREVRAMFDGLVPELRAIVEAAPDAPDGPLDSGWSDEAEAIRDAMTHIAAEIGLDPRRSRLDLASNAFCSSLSRDDARLTTRASDALKGVLSSTLHEMGHALYALNLDPAAEGTPLAAGHGLAAHESQSRLWENMVGRSPEFWTWALPRLAERLPKLKGVSVESAVAAVNRVRPELIRVGADELTYNLHILVRYELEVEIIEGRLAIRDLPDAWNAKYETHLGLTPPDDARGVLQDVHWSRGSVGYFPTYAMGNVVAGGLWAELGSNLDVGGLVSRGDFAPLRDWLTERVYRHGSGRFAREIAEAGGESYLNPAPWLSYARRRFAEI